MKKRLYIPKAYRQCFVSETKDSVLIVAGFTLPSDFEEVLGVHIDYADNKGNLNRVKARKKKIYGDK